MSEQKGMDRVMNEQKMYGYMRVSTREQNEERQRIALLEMGVPEKQIYNNPARKPMVFRPWDE